MTNPYIKSPDPMPTLSCFLNLVQFTLSTQVYSGVARVDVLFPVYNMSLFLEKSLESLLLQNFKDWRLILVDDGSTDSSLEIAERLVPKAKLKIIKLEQNVGLSKALNVGLKSVDAEFLARFDPDDYCTPDRFMTQVDLLSASAYINATSAPVRSINALDFFTYKFSWSDLDSHEVSALLPICNVINHPAVMFKYSELVDMGFYYREDPAQDYLTWLTFFNRLHWKVSSKPLLLWRKHQSNLSNKGYVFNSLYFEARKKALQVLGLDHSERIISQLNGYLPIESWEDVKSLKHLESQIKLISNRWSFRTQVNRAFDTLLYRSIDNFDWKKRFYIYSHMHTSTLIAEMQKRGKKKWNRV